MQELLPPVAALADSLTTGHEYIHVDRQAILKDLALAIKTQLIAYNKCDIITICTHNSRRSHLSQLLLKLGMLYYDINDVYTFSGGTEGTALNPRIAHALRELGFQVKKLDDRPNPKYQIPLTAEHDIDIYYSKPYQDAYNPQLNFIAMMVCNQADVGCPIVHGAERRFSIAYKDPKESDDTPEEALTYRAKVYEIGREMFFTAAFLKKLLRE